MTNPYLTGLSCIKGCLSSVFSSIFSAHSSKQETLAHHNLVFIFTQWILIVCLSFFNIILLKSVSTQGLIIFHLSCSTSHPTLIHRASPFTPSVLTSATAICHKQKWHALSAWTLSRAVLNTKQILCFRLWFLLTYCTFTSAWYSKTISFLRVMNQIRLSWASLKRQKARGSQ